MPETEIHNEQLQKSLEEQIQFEHLISNISARFIHIPLNRIDSTINEALAHILKFFQVDRIGLLRIHADTSMFIVIHQVCADRIPPVPMSVELPSSMFPFMYSRLIRDHNVSFFQSLDELPEEATIDRQTYESWGIRSAVSIPIGDGMPFKYAIVITSVTRECEWPLTYIPRLQLMGEIFANVLELKKARILLEDRLKFEEMLSRISARFVRMPSDRLDDEIENTLDQLVNFLGLDRVTVARFRNNNTRSIATHFSARPDIPMSWKELDNQELPWLLEKLQQEQSVEFSRLEDLPDKAGPEKAFFSSIGVRSCIVIPLVTRGHVLGFLGCSTLHMPKTWSKEVVQGLRLVADVFANAMARKHSDDKLQEAEQKYRTVLEFTHDWEYWANPDGAIEYMSPSCEQITGYPVQEYMDNPEKVKEIVVPEDRRLWDTHFHDSRMQPDAFKIEFRIRRRDGELRWLEHICRPMIDSQENFLGVRVSSRDITQRKNLEAQLQEKFQEIYRLRQLLEEENLYLRQEIQLQHVHEEIVGRCDEMKQVLSQVEQVSGTDSTVLILGETGTGKELLAKAIHHLSRFRDRPLVTVNCACLPPTLIESELFGREKGAFTGALTRMVGRFEVADGSTLFLDEIGELPSNIQSKLLRVLEEGRFERLGSNKTIQVKVRIIAATNRDLEQEVQDGRFRKDLYYRLNVFPISIPPLRNRSEDIPLLVWSLVKQLEQKIGKRINTISRKTMETLQRYKWPGNVRELRNVIEHAMILTKGTTLVVHLPDHAVSSDKPDDSALADLERRHIVGILGQTGWRISGNSGAAQILGMKRTTLQSRIKKLGIRRPGA
jgi:PAS domain S-box-containing protein